MRNSNSNENQELTVDHVIYHFGKIFNLEYVVRWYSYAPVINAVEQ